MNEETCEYDLWGFEIYDYNKQNTFLNDTNITIYLY